VRHIHATNLHTAQHFTAKHQSANPSFAAPIQAPAPRVLAAFRNLATPKEVYCDSTLLPTLS
jgi:hypothetical protein